MDRTIKSAHGLTLSRSFIFDRVLDTIPRLCWKPEDMGLTRVHIVQNTQFTSKKKAKAFAEHQGIPLDEITGYFGWVNDLCGMEGVKRENFLRNSYWPRREQIANSMFDAVLQAYTSELIPLFSELTDTAIGNLEYVESNTTNVIRKYTGQPDTVLIDETNKNIILIEIKIGGKTTKYTLDQHIKYIGLNVLLNTTDLLPSYRIHNILLAPEPEFASNTHGLDSIEPILQSNNYVQFNYANPDLTEFKPHGFDSINALVNARFQSLPGIRLDHEKDHTSEFALQFHDWKRLHSMLPEGEFKKNYEPLIPYLAGE